MESKNAVVLLSGGLDSTTIMSIAKSKGYNIYALSFNYGQRHSHEIEAACQVAVTVGVKKHLIIKTDFRSIGGSALTENIEVPKNRESKDIPITYVPARNTIFLSYALGWAEVLKINEIFIGVNAVDYSGYPDCRPEFINAFTKMANLATKTGVEGNIKIKIRTPLMNLSKAQIIQKGLSLGVDYSITHSCYDPDAYNRACGMCDSCLLRKQGFVELGLEDPVHYVKKM